MYNLSNLNDVEFEYLCKDIMARKLGVVLRRFAPGKDGGIDLTDDVKKKNIVVQVKHYKKSRYEQLNQSLKNEMLKVKRFKPKQYYLCCSKELSPQNIESIYMMFSEYMDSEKNIVTAIDISDFLDEQENKDILYKHFKLWIESTNVLNRIITGNIVCDSETLLSEMKELSTLFVKTRAYEEAIKRLENNNALIIIGDPGTGKTITSKMLALYYASQEYELKYTTDGMALNDLKKSLSLNKDTKEVILLDDCFGQAYFSMKETQENELLNLIKLVKRYDNKILIMNSRVTIFSEAKDRKKELVLSSDRKEYGIIVLNMNDILPIEKAKIFYNHLYVQEVGSEYLNDIKYNQKYISIVKHINYNPRIIEHVTMKSVYGELKPTEYAKFILDNLNHPQEIWKNEFERRLLETDRIFLFTIYSLTNTTVSEEVVKECFDARIENMSSVDLSINQFEQSERRLQDSMIKIIDQDGKKMLSVANPSVNDFLREQINKNSLEKAKIIKNARYIVQLKRLLLEEEYVAELRKYFEDGRILELKFDSNNRKKGFIVYFCGCNVIQDKKYESFIQEYVNEPFDFMFEEEPVSAALVFEKLVSKEMYTFYGLDSFLENMNCLQLILLSMDLRNVMKCINAIDYLYTGEVRKNYREIVLDSVKVLVQEYCDKIPADNYDIKIAKEIGLKRGIRYKKNNINAAVKELKRRVKEVALGEIYEYLMQLPKDCIIDEKFFDEIIMNIEGCEDLILEYLTPVKEEKESFEKQNEVFEDDDNEIRYIFER